jgi:hypothetical protein
MDIIKKILPFLSNALNSTIGRYIIYPLAIYGVISLGMSAIGGNLNVSELIQAINSTQECEVRELCEPCEAIDASSDAKILESIKSSES